MKFTPQQIKEAKKICIANGVNPKTVEREVSQCFYANFCNSSFEGYVSWLLNDQSNGSIVFQTILNSKNNIFNNQAGKSAM